MIPMTSLIQLPSKCIMLNILEYFQSEANQ